MTAPTGKRPGRPPQMALAQTSARSTFTVRMRGAVRAALIEASEKSGRSISEEMEARLEQSFELDRATDPATKALAEAVATMVGYHQIALGKSWTEDPRVARYIFGRVKNLLARSMRVKTDPEHFDDDVERAEAAAIDADADEHDAKEADLGRRWPSADEGGGNGILVRLLNVPMWPTKLKERYR